MRRFLVFLLIHAVAANAVAQPAPPPAGAPATPAVETGLTPDGKIKLGLDGRGNYRKAKKDRVTAAVAATPAAEPSKFKQAMQGNPTSDKPAVETGATPTASSTPPTTAAAAITPPAPSQPPVPADAPAKTLRSDKDLFSSNKPTQPATPAAAPVIPNTLPALQPNGGIYPQR